MLFISDPGGLHTAVRGVLGQRCAWISHAALLLQRTEGTESFWPLQTSNHHRIKSPSTHRLRPTCCHCSCHVLSHRDVSQTITASKTLHHTGMINYIHIKHTNMITFGSIGELSVTLIETCNRRIGCVFFCRPNSSKEKETWTLSKTLLTTNWRPSSLRSKIKNQKRNQKQMRSPLMSRPRRPWRWVFTTKQELQPVVNA